MQPTLFLNHGAPTLAITENDYTDFLKKLGQRLRPKAIVVFSAHWEEQVTTISFAEGPLETIYDFYGFPEEMYRITYPAPGAPVLAAFIEGLFQEHGVKTARSADRGLDHGSWVLLRHMYPAADIPVVSISVNPFLPPAEQYRIGEAVRSLGQDDILVIGSGSTVHNFNEIKFGKREPDAWAIEFDDWIADRIVNGKLEEAFAYEQLAPHARRAVPRPEHFIPLYLAMGSTSSSQQPKVLFSGYEWGTFSYRCFEF